MLCKPARTGNYGGRYEFVWNAKSHETVGNAKLAHLRTLVPSIIRITFEWYAKNFPYLCECTRSIKDTLFGNKKRKSIRYLRCHWQNIASTIFLFSSSLFASVRCLWHDVRVGYQLLLSFLSPYLSSGYNRVRATRTRDRSETLSMHSQVPASSTRLDFAFGLVTSWHVAMHRGAR